MRSFNLSLASKLYSLATGPNSYLRGKGWLESVSRKRPVDIQGRPLPWLSYPFIDFVEPRLDTTMRVLEFGTGYSTMFWARHVGEVYGVEHDALWQRELAAQLPGNAEVRLVKFDPADPDAYSHAADDLGLRFDIVVVDGPERNATLLHAAEVVRESGVIVLDNAMREQYRATVQALQDRFGFRRIDFKGMCPGAVRESCTALFYRPGNCLGV